MNQSLGRLTRIHQLNFLEGKSIMANKNFQSKAAANAANMTDDQIADFCAGQTREAIVKYLTKLDVEVKKKESKASLVKKATDVAIRLRDTGNAMEQENASGDDISMQDLIAKARETKKTTKSKKEKGPNKTHVAYASIVKCFLDNPKGLTFDELYKQTPDGMKENAGESSKNTLNCRLSFLRTAFAVFGLGSFETDRQSKVMTLTLTAEAKKAYNKSGLSFLSNN